MSAWRRNEDHNPRDNRNRDRYRIEGPTARVNSGLGYVGDGNYSSGEFGSNAPNDYDYDYAGSKGDAGLDEYGDQQYGGGRYGAGPFEQSQQYGGSGFSSGRGPFGSLQRQYENRFVSGGHRGSFGDHFGYAGHDDAGDRGVDQGAYYRPLSYDDNDSRDRSAYAGFSRTGGDAYPGEISGAPDWRSAPDLADPAGYRIFDYYDEERTRHRGRFLGRGPKGYRRSDERILEEIYERLLGDPHVDSSDVLVEVHEGTATLTGSVPQRRMKHAIEDLVDRVRGVQQIDNRIRVQQPPQLAEDQA